jgi:hypothetical protein
MCVCIHTFYGELGHGGGRAYILRLKSAVAKHSQSVLMLRIYLHPCIKYEWLNYDLSCICGQTMRSAGMYVFLCADLDMAEAEHMYSN